MSQLLRKGHPLLPRKHHLQPRLCAFKLAEAGQKLLHVLLVPGHVVVALAQHQLGQVEDDVLFPVLAHMCAAVVQKGTEYGSVGKRKAKGEWATLHTCATLT